jgi:membrane-bound serine protease (ClpP class)
MINSRQIFLSILALVLGFAGVLLGSDPLRDLKSVPPETEPPVEEALPLPAEMETPAPVEEAASPLFGEAVTVYRVPITEAISKPNLYILRRSLKQAIDEGVDVIVLDMDTPGGRLDVTLDMMELLDRFEGETVTFVNKDAISAGAYISMATDAIYFAPNGVMGAAAVVAGGGQEIDESMKAKINSYLLARMRSYTEQYPYRAEVIRAMADIDYELTIDETVLKKPGELLSLTATEAVAEYGSPPRPLLADGIADDLEALLAQRYGEGNAEVVSFEVTWSESVAKYLDSIAPILLGLGFLGLFVELKTPGFGIIGIAGLSLIVVVFIGNYMAGLAGLEGILFFMLGLIFIIVDIFLLPGTFFFLILGLLFVFGALLWSLADIWPASDPDGSGFSFTVDADSLWLAVYELMGAFGVTLIGLILIWRLLPKTPFYGRLVHSTVGAMPDPAVTGGSQVAAGASLPDIGSSGIVKRPLHPLGEIEVDGKRYQASVSVGSLDAGTPVIVTGYRNFSLLVEKKEDA